MTASALESFLRLRKRILVYGKMIRFSHTAFALPFALSAVVLAGRNATLSLSDLFWVMVAVVAARSAAMGVNRIADAPFDAKNPRTHSREIPARKISVFSAIFFVVFFSALFILAAAMLGRLCLILSGPVLFVLFFYSFTKRFTWLCHIYLGFAISLAPIGAWIAVTDSFSWPILLISVALLTHIAGFDILYACQDAAFDREHNLCSIPAEFGIKRAMRASTIIHAGSFCAFTAFYFAFGMGPIYLGSVIIIGVLLFLEHRLVKPANPTKINPFFFHVNSLVSVTLFLGVFFDRLI